MAPRLKRIQSAFDPFQTRGKLFVHGNPIVRPIAEISLKGGESWDFAKR